MYGITNSGKLSSDALTECFINEAGFKIYKFQMSINYRYAPEIVVLSYVDDCVYWYIYEALVKCFVDNLRNRFNVKFLGFSH